MVFGAASAVIARESAPFGTAALVSAFIAAAPYVFGAEAMAPRFLLPAFALMTTAAGIGVLGLIRTSGAPLRALGIVALLVVVSVWNWPTVSRLGHEQADLRAQPFALGRSLSERMAEDCFFLSQYGFPQIAFVSGCEGSRLVYTSNGALSISGRFELLGARWRGQDVATVSLSGPPKDLDPLVWECQLRPLSPPIRGTYASNEANPCNRKPATA